MDIAILGGTGKEGAGLGARWARAGHSILIGSRDAARAAESPNASAYASPYAWPYSLPSVAASKFRMSESAAAASAW